MALMYPWATKEYLLWEMSLGQIFMYLAIGFEQKYPKPAGEQEKPTLKGKSYEELAAIREDMKASGLIESDPLEVMRERYGAIDG